MKKLAIFALAASAIAMAAPASAQVLDTTGTITINGSVANRCSVLPGGGNSWGGTVEMDELAQSDGTLKTSATLAAKFASAGGSAIVAKIVCNTNDANITVDADPLIGSGTTTTGYTKQVDYQADVTLTKVSGSSTYSNDTNAAASAPTAIGDRLSTTVANNVSVATSNWRTLTSGDVLLAGSYVGHIYVTIAPLVTP